ncbi:MAG: hypothetical protein R3E60_00685 [Alphaproteobacteria bacterium]
MISTRSKVLTPFSGSEFKTGVKAEAEAGRIGHQAEGAVGIRKLLRLRANPHIATPAPVSVLTVPVTATVAAGGRLKMESSGKVKDRVHRWLPLIDS